MKFKFNAKYILYLLALFDNKLGFNDIINMDLPLLLEMRRIKEGELEEQAKKLQSQNNANK